jgi:hypothetical protein
VTEVRVALPAHLRTLARVEQEVSVDVAGTLSVSSVLDALEARYPVLRGTIRDYGTHKRRAFIRYFACGQDLSLDPPDAPLPAAIGAGEDAFCVIGAIAGG